MMNPKLLLFLTWLFFVIERHTSDHIWLICMIYSAILAVCAFFHQRENTTTVVVQKERART